jgi:ubiquinone biosynthesis protein COQ9
MTMTMTTPPPDPAGAGRDAGERTRRRDALLMAALPHVVFDGWGRATLAAAARDLGLKAADAERYFPGGAAELIAHFSDWADRRMTVALAEHELGGMRLRDRIALAVRTRTEALAAHREAVRRALSWLAMPLNAPLGLRLLYRSVDAIWRAVGDRSVDFSFYTKRALLAGVLSSTVLYWLDDDSDGAAESWAFLDRRIADVMRIPRLTGRVRGAAARLPDPFRLMRGLRGGARRFRRA